MAFLIAGYIAYTCYRLDLGVDSNSLIGVYLLIIIIIIVIFTFEVIYFDVGITRRILFQIFHRQSDALAKVSHYSCTHGIRPITPPPPIFRVSSLRMLDT